MATTPSPTRRIRSVTCGELSAKDLDREVTLCGWVNNRRDHGGVVFVDLRDRYGLTQVVFDPKIDGGKNSHVLADLLRSEFVLWCKGKVRLRPDGMKNDKMATGEVEVACTELEIFSEAKTPPFVVDESHTEAISDNLRLKYRYLDLRRPSIQRNLLIRNQMISVARDHLEQNGFLEIETPILYKSTPEGARDFIVPSRLNQGNFYALPQSPQTLKQLLMIGGMDRYYQIARCFRDEDFRADRQPEFSQIDIEASFVDEEILFPMLEDMMKKMWKRILDIDIETPFQIMGYHEAMTRFGSDRPDVRFGLELQDLSEIFAKSEFKVFASATTTNSRGEKGAIRALHVEGKAADFSRKDLDELTKTAASHGAKGLLWIKIQEGGEMQSPAAKFFSDDEKSQLTSKLGLKPGDLVMIVADSKDKTVCNSLGAIRLEVGEKLGVVPKPEDHKYAFLWVNDFPLVEYDDKDGRYYALHHPFTMPKKEYFDQFIAGEKLGEIPAAAYDLVLNGSEIAGGSLRIYRSDVQDAMFKALGMSADEAQARFGFFLEALKYGTPPHGGIAFGVDRLAGILSGVSAIREVMAFPKTQKGTCLMSESPAKVDPEQLVDLGISLRPTKK